MEFWNSSSSRKRNFPFSVRRIRLSTVKLYIMYFIFSFSANRNPWRKGQLFHINISMYATISNFVNGMFCVWAPMSLSVISSLCLYIVQYTFPLWFLKIISIPFRWNLTNWKFCIEMKFLCVQSCHSIVFYHFILFIFFVMKHVIPTKMM